jgi:hypothetical protein
VDAAMMTRDMDLATVDPRPHLGEHNYYQLVRENLAAEALTNAAIQIPVSGFGVSYREVLLAALAGAAKHAKHYHDGMTERRKKALQDIKDAEEMLAQARRELVAAEDEERAFPDFPV